MSLADLGMRPLLLRDAGTDTDAVPRPRPAVAARRMSVDVVAALLGSAGLAFVVPSSELSTAGAAMVGVVLVAAWVVAVWRSDGYRDRVVDHGAVQVHHVLRAGIEFTVVTTVLAWWLVPGLPRGAVLGAVAATVGVSVAHRAAASSRLIPGNRQQDRRRVLVVGHPAESQQFVDELGRQRSGRLDVADVCPPEVDHVAARADELGVDGVILLPCSHLAPQATRRLAWRLAEQDRHLLISPGLVDVQRHRTSVAPLGGLPMLHVRHTRSSCAGRSMTQLCARLAAAIGLVVLTPFLLALALAIRWDSPGPALFRQTRVGRDGVRFTMFKFRTMRSDGAIDRKQLQASNDCDGVLFKIRSDPRITRLGAVLRRYSLDELPQLINVVRGEMALVGPRPALPEEVAAYAPDVHRRLAALPGITGLWQVSGRSDLTWDESVRLDLSYVDNWSPGLDLRILLRTASAVIGHRGAY